ncbi:ATP-binding protein [Streptomyces albus subsp. chlorinus]|uniref:ATP-binding protein n=1 Tax=Streptomyces albus TaxID=1888 RepID=UPI00156FBFDF|nr:ATP-binding protein [Streptomyces albus]NSC21990.1 ATP-binding protein [Streptomyces albus subsp. chlorinus]
MNRETHLPHFREHFYRRERRSVPRSRAFVRDALAAWGVPGRRGDDVVLCVSEMATNALLHGVPPGRGFRVMLWLEHDGVLRVEVHDSGDGAPRVRPADENAESGRGLLLVEALADKWGVGPRNPGKVVWAEFSGCCATGVR